MQRLHPWLWAAWVCLLLAGCVTDTIGQPPPPENPCDEGDTEVVSPDEVPDHIDVQALAARSGAHDFAGTWDDDASGTIAADVAVDASQVLFTPTGPADANCADLWEVEVAVTLADDAGRLEHAWQQTLPADGSSWSLSSTLGASASDALLEALGLSTGREVFVRVDWSEVSPTLELFTRSDDPEADVDVPLFSPAS